MWIKVNDTTLEVIAACINEISIEAGFTVYDIDDDDMPDDLINPDYGFAQYQFFADGYGTLPTVTGVVLFRNIHQVKLLTEKMHVIMKIVV